MVTRLFRIWKITSLIAASGYQAFLVRKEISIRSLTLVIGCTYNLHDGFLELPDTNLLHENIISNTIQSTLMIQVTKSYAMS